MENLIGNTPLTLLETLSTAKARIYAKLEGNNPGGSVKDRPAWSMIQHALRTGLLQPDGQSRIIEPTSGNTGIALAMIAAKLQIPITLVMPENATPERVKAMRAYGADVILTPAEKTIEYSRLYAEQLAQQNNWYMPNQFANPQNPLYHYQTTGPEIWRDTRGKITHFVSAMGTTGTITGVGRYLKAQNPHIQVIGAQPDDNGGIPGIRKWSPDFVPAIFDPSVVDQTITVSRDEAIDMARHLARREGLLCGMSGGGAVKVAQKLLQTLPPSHPPALIVCIIPDRGDRYLSSDLFD